MIILPTSQHQDRNDLSRTTIHLLRGGDGWGGVGRGRGFLDGQRVVTRPHLCLQKPDPCNHDHNDDDEEKKDDEDEQKPKHAVVSS